MFHKIHVLRCPGADGKGCNFTIEAARRDLPLAVESMKAHCADRAHKLDLAKERRTFRIAPGLPGEF